jgi:hypothetical protein
MVESAELPETLGPAWLLKALILRPTYGLEILLRRFDKSLFSLRMAGKQGFFSRSHIPDYRIVSIIWQRFRAEFHAVRA